AAETQTLRQTGEAAHPREEEQGREHDREDRALHDCLQRRAGEPADRARETEADEHVATDVRADEKKAPGRPPETGKRHRRDREANIRSEERRVGKEGREWESLEQ